MTITDLRRLASRAKGPARLAWFVLVAVFVVRYLARNWDEVVDQVERVAPIELGAIVAVTIAGKLVVSEQARISTRLLGWIFTPIDMLWMYSSSDVAKYVPGGVWNVLARVRLYTQRGMTAGESARAFSLEKFWQVTGAFFASLIFLLPELADRYPLGDGATVRVVQMIVLVAAWFAVTGVGTRLIGGTVTFEATVRAVVDQAIVAVALGAGVWIPLASLGWNEPLLAIGGFALGRAAGYVALFAPAGIGVREIVTAWALAGPIPNDVALVALGANRVLTFVADVVCFLGAAALVRLGAAGSGEDGHVDGADAGVGPRQPDPSNRMIGRENE